MAVASKTTHTIVEQALNYLRLYDEKGLRRYLQAHWTHQDLIQCLDSDDHDLVKVAAVCLSVSPDKKSLSGLLAVLAHEDAAISRMAEFALWTLWFGQYGPDAEAGLRRAIIKPYSQAIRALDQLIQQNTDWAEAYNQRAIVHFANGRLVSALDDCKEAIHHQEYHFGALAGMGHTYAKLNMHTQAIHYYQQALAIHPRMQGVRQCLIELRNSLQTN